jgi:hypothetical protein
MHSAIKAAKAIPTTPKLTPKKIPKIKVTKKHSFKKYYR